MITEYIELLLQKKNLSFEQATSLLDIVFEGEVAEVQIAAFLTAMRGKSATAAELAGFARSLRSHAVAVKVNVDNLVDTCGTGGAAVKTFNISTAAALVAAGAGLAGGALVFLGKGKIAAGVLIVGAAPTRKGVTRRATIALDTIAV